MLSGNITGVFAQRLVGLNCNACRYERLALPDECKLLGVAAENPPTLWDAPGCDACHLSGIKGRTAIAEIIYIDDGLNELIATRSTRIAMRNYLRDHGHRTMADDGVERVLKGDISLQSLMRAADLTSRM